jgi:hypothetical protein
VNQHIQDVVVAVLGLGFPATAQLFVVPFRVPNWCMAQHPDDQPQQAAFDLVARGY